MTAAAAGLSLVAGLAGAVQIAVMGRLGDRVGVVEALAFATLTTAVLAAAVLLVPFGFGFLVVQNDRANHSFPFRRRGRSV